MYCNTHRKHLVMAIKSAKKLVVKGRGTYGYDNLKNHLCCMIELFLLLRGKLYIVNDEEIESLMLNDWNLYTFIQEFIQALMPSKAFGGYQKQYHKEIKVGRQLVNLCGYGYSH